MDLACTDHLQRRPVIQLGIRSIEPSTEIRNAASHQTQRPSYLLKIIGVSKKLRPAGAFLGNFTVVFFYKHLSLHGLPDRRRFHLGYSTWFQPDFHHLPYQKTI